MNSISVQTRITLGLAVSVIGGGAAWLTSLASEVRQVKEEVIAIKSDQKLDRAVIYQMATDIAVIKTLLEKQKGK